MDQIERITHMENILNAAKEALSALEKALDRYDAVREGLAELEAYYSGRLWMQDFEDDRAGKIPRDLRRGVLSEDAVYNLLTDQFYLLERIQELGED